MFKTARYLFKTSYHDKCFNVVYLFWSFFSYKFTAVGAIYIKLIIEIINNGVRFYRYGFNRYKVNKYFINPIIIL